MSKGFELYLSVPRAASFAVTLKIGVPRALTQPNLPSIEPEIWDQPTLIVDDVLTCLDLYSKGNTQELRDLIGNEAYFTNFTALADRLAPDGDRIRLVGLTILRDGREKSVALKRRDPPTVQKVRPTSDLVEVTGILRFADSRKAKRGRINIVDEKGQQHLFIVKEGLSDIVSDLWDQQVLAEGTKTNQKPAILDRIITAPAATNGQSKRS